MRGIGRKGLTLMEVVVAIGLVSVCLLALVGVFTHGLQLMSRSAELTTATEIGREFLERVKLAGHANIPVGMVFDGAVPSPLTANGFPVSPYPITTVDGRTYELRVRTALVAGTVNTVSVQVEVGWGEGSGVKLETYIHP